MPKNLDRVLYSLQGTNSTLDSRIIMLYSDIVNGISQDVNSQLLELQCQDPLKDITLIVNSYGGEIDEMFAIIDMMNIVQPDIRTIVNGKAMSAGAFVAICGTKGKRFMTENSRLMIHSVSGGSVGTVQDIKIDVAELNRANDHIINMVSQKSNLSVSEVKDLMERDRYILPKEAIEMGLIDGILTSLK